MARVAVVAGALARRPDRGGHAWVFLNWLLGLRALGFDVTFVDRHEAPTAAHAAWLATVLDGAGLEGRWSLLDDAHGRDRGARPWRAAAGLDGDEVAARIADAEVAVDVMGYLGAARLRSARRTVFLDVDPGFGHLWEQLGQATLFGGYDHHVTVGGNLGRPGCPIPTRGHAWIPVLPPVVLDAWAAPPPPSGAPITSVATWRGPFAPIAVEGDVLGLRVHQFRRYADLPARTSLPFRLALDIDAADAADAERLRAGGWCLVDPVAAAGTPDAFRAFVLASAAEIGVAKDLYVRTGSGWVSDRSACYLAAGRPVLHHDTGVRDRFCGDAGLLLFAGPAEAAAAAGAVARDPVGHGEAARALARERFAAEVVLAGLLDRIGVA